MNFAKEKNVENYLFYVSQEREKKDIWYLVTGCNNYMNKYNFFL